MPVMGIAVGMVMMVVPVVMIVVVPMIVIVAMAMPLNLRRSASTDGTHHATSISLIRISSPATGISRAPPHSGQGASRSSISTSRAQS